MVLGLAPPQRPKGDRRSRRAALVLHGLALIAGGASTGLILGSMGALAHSVTGAVAIVAIGAVTAYAGMDLGWWRLPRVAPSWQVPRSWLRDVPDPLAYAGFGFLLGLGFLTAVPFAAFSGLLLLEFASGGAATGAFIGAMYGLGRFSGLLLGIRTMGESGGPTAGVVLLMARASTWHPRLGLGSLFVCFVHFTWLGGLFQ